MCADLRRNSEIRVSEGTLKNILWHIEEPGKISKFLSELIPGRATLHFEDSDEMSKPVQEPLRELMEWSKKDFEENPVVLLSLALERSGCTPVDRTFFCGEHFTGGVIFVSSNRALFYSFACWKFNTLRIMRHS